MSVFYLPTPELLATFLHNELLRFVDFSSSGQFLKREQMTQRHINIAKVRNFTESHGLILLKLLKEHRNGLKNKQDISDCQLLKKNQSKNVSRSLGLMFNFQEMLSFT